MTGSNMIDISSMEVNGLKYRVNSLNDDLVKAREERDQARQERDVAMGNLAIAKRTIDAMVSLSGTSLSRTRGSP